MAHEYRLNDEYIAEIKKHYPAAKVRAIIYVVVELIVTITFFSSAIFTDKPDLLFVFYSIFLGLVCAAPAALMVRWYNNPKKISTGIYEHDPGDAVFGSLCVAAIFPMVGIPLVGITSSLEPPLPYWFQIHMLFMITLPFLLFAFEDQIRANTYWSMKKPKEVPGGIMRPAYKILLVGAEVIFLAVTFGTILGEIYREHDGGLFIILAPVAPVVILFLALFIFDPNPILWFFGLKKDEDCI